jgi:hypothetical protein
MTATRKISTGGRHPSLSCGNLDNPVFQVGEIAQNRLSAVAIPSFSRGSPHDPVELRYTIANRNAAGLGTDGVIPGLIPLLPLRPRPSNCKRLGSRGTGLHLGGVSVLNPSGWGRGCPPGPRRALLHPGRDRGLERPTRKPRSSDSRGPSRGVATRRTRSSAARTASGRRSPSRRPRSPPTRRVG